MVSRRGVCRCCGSQIVTSRFFEPKPDEPFDLVLRCRRCGTDTSFELCMLINLSDDGKTLKAKTLDDEQITMINRKTEYHAFLSELEEGEEK